MTDGNSFIALTGLLLLLQIWLYYRSFSSSPCADTNFLYWQATHFLLEKEGAESNEEIWRGLKLQTLYFVRLALHPIKHIFVYIIHTAYHHHHHACSHNITQYPYYIIISINISWQKQVLFEYFSWYIITYYVHTIHKCRKHFK